MKWILIGSLLFISSLQLRAQVQPGDDYEGRLYRLCKVWGYVKYFHRNVNSCQVDWDSALVATIPTVKAATDSNDFNAAVLQMLQVAGPISIDTSPSPNLSTEVAVNTDTNWMQDTYFSQAIRDSLLSIRINFRPRALCNIEVQTPQMNSYLEFPADSITVMSAYPTEAQRLLLVFRYWNVIYYFYPDTRIPETSWDSTLLNNVLNVSSAGDSISFFKAFLKIQASLDDGHSETFTFSNTADFPGAYTPDILARYVEGQYVIIYSIYSSIQVGDVIDSVDLLGMQQWEDSLRPYISAGNTAAFRESVCNFGLFSGVRYSNVNIVFHDSTNTSHSIVLSRTNSIHNWSLIATSLNMIQWSKVGCDIGYINLSQISDGELPRVYDSLRTAPAIIFDSREYPNEFYTSIFPLLVNGEFTIAKLLYPDLTYPGYFYWDSVTASTTTNATPYTGTIIVLMNQDAQSAPEFECMAFEQSKTLGQHVIKIGSETAGADGNVSLFNLSTDISTGFTSLGVYYPDGANTQRVGILPDIEVYPTIAGIRAHKDELLDTAIAIACSLSAIQPLGQQPGFKLYPNPGNNIVTVTNNQEWLSLKIYNDFGSLVMNRIIESSNETMDIGAFADGIYFVSGYDKNSNPVGSIKLVKQ
jgi:carboxyl-terminal processing protease